jgi:hypothetical protein
VRVAQIQVGVVAGLLGGRADRGDHREPGREVPGAQAGLQPTEQEDPPAERFVGDLLPAECAHRVILTRPL